MATLLHLLLAALQQWPQGSNVRFGLDSKDRLDQIASLPSAQEWFHQVASLGLDFFPSHRIVGCTANGFDALSQ
jgi:hypothetical protein